MTKYYMQTFEGQTDDKLRLLLHKPEWARKFCKILERIGTEISLAFSVLANIIPIVGSIKLLTSCKGLMDGQYDYKTDLRTLQSQSGIN